MKHKKWSQYFIGLSGESVAYKRHHSSSFLKMLWFILYPFSNSYKTAKLLQNCGDFGEDLISKGNIQFIKIWPWALRKYLLYVTLLICLHRSIVIFWGLIKNIF